jgi:RNA polymerase sigma-70 factor (ECF subfamily)
MSAIDECSIITNIYVETRAGIERSCVGRALALASPMNQFLFPGMTSGHRPLDTLLRGGDEDTTSPSDAAQLSPENLTARLARGEASALASLYDEHHQAVRAFARRLLGDEAAAEDLVHEVFVTIPKAIRGYRGESSLRTFLISVAVNHARHHVRASARRRAMGERFAREPQQGGASPEQDTLRRELAAALQRALDQLPLDQRVTFVLSEVEERRSPEVSAILGVPEGTVRTRLFHAKRKLRELLEAEGTR